MERATSWELDERSIAMSLPSGNDDRGDDISRAPGPSEEAATSSTLPLLRPSMIRVIDLVLNRDADEVTLTLRVVDLDDRPAFNALSYVWGTDYGSHILHDTAGRPIRVTENCYDAVQQLGRSFGQLTSKSVLRPNTYVWSLPQIRHWTLTMDSLDRCYLHRPKR